MVLSMQMEERVAELEGMVSSSRHSRRSASNSPSPERSDSTTTNNNTNNTSGRLGRRHSGRSNGSVVGTFDEASPRDSSEMLSARAGGMPPIQEESGDAKAGPDNDALDAQFQNLMNEITMNLGYAWQLATLSCSSIPCFV